MTLPARGLPPKIVRQIGERPEFKIVDARFGAWPEIRQLARNAGCECHEVRTGFISKTFTVTGDIECLQEFLNAAWYSTILGAQLQRTVLEMRRMV